MQEVEYKELPSTMEESRPRLHWGGLLTEVRALKEDYKAMAC